MNSACHCAILDLHNPMYHFSLVVKKGDTGRTMQFTLVDGGEPYTISNDCYAVFTAKKPNGNIVYNACEITGNSIFYHFTAQTCSEAGTIPCEIRLYGADNKLITSPNFLLIVEDTVYSDGDTVESLSEATMLTQLLNSTTALVSDLEQKLAENAFADAHSAVCYTSQSLLDVQKAQARENISAAPSGYGLNNDFTTTANASTLDSYRTCGWYRYINNAAESLVSGFGIYYAVVRVDSYSESSFAVQTAYPMYDTYAGASLRRIFRSGTWGDWEWENPPMALGVEYRTTKRYLGKPVYTMVLDFGAMPNTGAKTVYFSTPSGTLGGMLACSGITDQGDTLPYVTDVSDYSIACAAGAITITTNRDKSGVTAYVITEYWKSNY